MGVDGFRMDAIKHFFEQDAAMEELPETHEWLAAYQTRLRTLKPDMLTVGEVYSATDLSAAYVPDDVSLTFDFGFAENVVGGLYAGGAGQAIDALRASLEDYPPGQRAVFLTNHDQTRTMTKLGGDINAARAAGAMLLDLIGRAVHLLRRGAGHDRRQAGRADPYADALDRKLPAVGFTSGTPWETVGDGAQTANVAGKTSDPVVGAGRLSRPDRAPGAVSVAGGAETVIRPSSEAGVYAVLRHLGDETTLVLVNFGLELESPSFDLSVAPCVTSGMRAEAIGARRRSPRSRSRAYVPSRRWHPTRSGSSSWAGPAPRRSRRVERLVRRRVGTRCRGDGGTQAGVAAPMGSLSASGMVSPPVSVPLSRARCARCARTAQQLERGGIEFVRPPSDALGALGPVAQPLGDRFARQQDQVGGAVHERQVLATLQRRGHELDVGHPASRSVSAMFSTPRDDAQIRPSAIPGAAPSPRAPGPRSRAPRASRRPAPGRRRMPALPRLERGRRDEVVVEAVEPVRKIVEQRPFGLDPVGEGLDDAFRIESRVGFGALREQHADQRPGPLALGRRGEGRGGDLVGAVAELRAAPQELVDDAGQRLVAATDGGRSATCVPAPWRLVT